MEFDGDAGAQYLPPGGRGTAKRWMRNGDRYRFPKHPNFPEFVQMLYRNSDRGKKIRFRHSSSAPFGGTFPRGEGIAFPYPLKASPKGIPHFISHILHLISSSPAEPFRPRVSVMRPPKGNLPNFSFNGATAVSNIFLIKTGGKHK